MLFKLVNLLSANGQGFGIDLGLPSLGASASGSAANAVNAGASAVASRPSGFNPLVMGMDIQGRKGSDVHVSMMKGVGVLTANGTLIVVQPLPPGILVKNTRTGREMFRMGLPRDSVRGNPFEGIATMFG